LAPADAEAMVHVVEIYRLAGKQRPAKKGKRPCISE
jgi:hypothetical protein